MKWKIINDEWINDYKKYKFNSMCIKKKYKENIFIYKKKHILLVTQLS